MASQLSSTSYQILLLLHLLCVVAAFGPTLIYPAIARFARNNPGETGDKVAALPGVLNKKLFLPALVAAAVFGLLLVADSANKVFDMSKPWVSGAFVVVLVLIGVAYFLFRPAQARLVEGLSRGEAAKDEVRKARATLSASTGIFHLGLIVLIALMIWKPGQ